MNIDPTVYLRRTQYLDDFKQILHKNNLNLEQFDHQRLTEPLPDRERLEDSFRQKVIRLLLRTRPRLRNDPSKAMEKIKNDIEGNGDGEDPCYTGLSVMNSQERLVAMFSRVRFVPEIDLDSSVTPPFASQLIEDQLHLRGLDVSQLGYTSMLAVDPEYITDPSDRLQLGRALGARALEVLGPDTGTLCRVYSSTYLSRELVSDLGAEKLWDEPTGKSAFVVWT